MNGQRDSHIIFLLYMFCRRGAKTQRKTKGGPPDRQNKEFYFLWLAESRPYDFFFSLRLCASATGF
jgi:hypothetical protein